MRLALGLVLACPAALGAVLVASELRLLRRQTRVGGRMVALVDAAIAAPEIERRLWAAVLALGCGCVGRQGQRQRIGRQLVGAGIFDPRALALFGFLRLAVALLGAAAGVLAATKLPLPHLAYPALPPIGLVLGFYLPALLLDAYAAGQTRRTRVELPIVMSLVLMTIESGSTVDQALRFASQAAARAHMSVTRLLRRLIDEIGQGAAYEQALARFGERIDVGEGRDFATLLAQSITAGTQIGDGLQILITDLLEKRVAAARESIGRRAVLVSVILILCFLPVLFILIGAPMASSLFHALSHAVAK